MTALSILRLIPDPPGKIVGGSILYKGQDLLKLSWEEIRKVRGNEISMIFQEPMTSLNPVFTIGMQIMEVILEHNKVSKKEAFDRSVKMLELVGIPAAASRMNDYPHQFSGGMRQRVMIAIALACDPSLLIADEPTTALDVTIQAQILELMLKVKDERKDAAILLITHNLAVVAETCHRVMVMYGGKIQEIAPVRELFKNPHASVYEGPAGVPADRRRQEAGPAADHSRQCAEHSRSAGRLQVRHALSGAAREVLDLSNRNLIEVSPGHWVRCRAGGESNDCCLKSRICAFDFPSPEVFSRERSAKCAPSTECPSLSTAGKRLASSENRDAARAPSAAPSSIFCAR